MRKYKVVFTVDLKRTETIVSALGPSAARDLVEMQYPGRKVSIISCNEVR